MTQMVFFVEKEDIMGEMNWQCFLFGHRWGHWRHITWRLEYDRWQCLYCETKSGVDPASEAFELGGSSTQSPP